MVFSLLMVIIVVTVAYFHFAQGFFSAFLSLVMALVAAAIALGMFEPLVFKISQGKFSDESHGVMLCVLFALTYIILRAAFDKMVPGNVNFGSTPDKIGAALCGLIVGLLTAGIVAIATQTLPFGPSIGMYSRFGSLGNQNVNMGAVPNWARVGRSDITSQLVKHDEVLEPKLDPKKASGLWIAVDDFALGYLKMVSAGSLAGDKKWTDEHADYPTELFAQRIGIQPGGLRTAYPVDGKSNIEVRGIWKAPKEGYPQIDGDDKDFRPAGYEFPESKLTPGEGQTLVTVRVMVHGVADTDGRVRFSLSSFRLFAGGKNYFPVAWLRDHDGPQAVFQRADDFLFLDKEKVIDLVFSVDTESLVGKDTPAEGTEVKVASGAFLEFKRLSRATLSGQELKGPDTFEVDPAAMMPLRREGWGTGEKK